MIRDFILNLFKIKERNIFDKRFGFILKNKIDSEENYELTKSFFFRNRSKYP